MDMFLHIIDLFATGFFTSLCVLALARVGLFPSVVITYYVEKGEGEQ